MQSKVIAFFDSLRVNGPDATAALTLEYFASRLRPYGQLGALASRLHRAYHGRRRSGPSLFLASSTDLGVHDVDRATLVAGDDRAPLIWRAAEAQVVPVHRGLLSELCFAADHPAPLAMFGARSYDAMPVQFIRIRDASVFPGWGAVMPRPGRFWSESVGTARWSPTGLEGIPGVYREQRDLRFRRHTAPARRVIDGLHLIAAHRASSNYGHWHMDSLPSVLAFEDELRSGTIRLLVPPLSTFQRQSLARLGLSAAVDECHLPAVFCRDLICGTHLSGRGTQRPPVGITRVFERMRHAGRRQGRCSTPALIYIGRDDRPKGRVMVNEAEVVAALGKLGFVSVNPAKLDYDDQIETMSAARVVIGPHGAGLTNVGFAPPDCAVIEIMPEPHLQPWIFQLTALLGQSYAYVFAPLSVAERSRIKWSWPDTTRHDYTYSVDIDSVLRAAEGAYRLAA